MESRKMFHVKLFAILSISLIVSSIFDTAFAEISRIKDRTGKVVGYITVDEDSGAVRIKDRTMKTVGYITGEDR